MSYFVTIEGIEGAGKSTLRTKVAEAAAQMAKEVVVTREPGATALGQAVRAIVLDSEQKKMSPVAELMLFAADRAQHVEEIIRPALARGALVLCDRYIHSTLAYQGYGRGLPLESLHDLNRLTTGGLTPDLVLLLDLAPAVGLERAKSRAQRASGTIDTSAIRESGAKPAETGWNRFEEQTLDFHNRVREGFLSMAKDSGGQFHVLNADQPAERVAAEAIKALQGLVAKGPRF